MPKHPVDQTYPIADAQIHLAELVAAAQAGKTIAIVDELGQAVQLVPMPPTAQSPREPGSAAGRIRIAPNFDDPLPDFDDYLP